MQPLVPLTHDSDTDRWKASYRDNIKMENQAKKCKRMTFTRQCFTNWTNGLFVLHQAPKTFFRSNQQNKFAPTLRMLALSMEVSN